MLHDYNNESLIITVVVISYSYDAKYFSPVKA